MLHTSPIPWFHHSNNQDRFNTFWPLENKTYASCL
jgi:hypothetical protein